MVDAAVRQNPMIVLALPTGATPIGMYAELVRLHQETGTDWNRVTIFNLDEYVGVPPDHPESYAWFMEQHFYRAVNVSSERRHLPNGIADEPAAEAVRYESSIEAAGGIDLAVLGIGTNGHLGFNEPAGSLIAETHVAELSDETWRRNFPDLARVATPGGDEQLPFRRAYTMGIGTIVQARRILLLASGASKREILHQAFTAPITTHNPASFLRLHRDVTILVDREAAWAAG
jgi:glucosamine-6-phosphate deaminase